MNLTPHQKRTLRAGMFFPEGFPVPAPTASVLLRHGLITTPDHAHQTSRVFVLTMAGLEWVGQNWSQL